MAAAQNHRRISLIAGLLYLLTFISIPTLSLYAPTKESEHVTGSGLDTAAVTGGILELIMALACIGTAVVLYPMLKKQSKSMGLGLVSARILEAAIIFAGVAVIFTLVDLRQAELGADMHSVGQMLSILYDKLFLVSQSLLPAVNNLLLGTLLWQSRLIPRGVSIIGLIGSPLLIVGFVGMVFGVIEQGSPAAGLAAILVAIFELAIGLWLTFRGFNTQAVEQLEARKA